MSEGLFDDTEIANKKEESEWSGDDIDRLLNLYFEGAKSQRCALELDRSPKSIKQRLEAFFYNKQKAAEKYKPGVLRAWRNNEPLTSRDWIVLDAHASKELPGDVTAVVLARSSEEVADIIFEKVEDIVEKAGVIPHGRAYDFELDLLMAYRYAYYCENISLIPDQIYDKLEKEFWDGAMNFEKEELEKPGSDNREHYRPAVRALGMYLIFRNAKRV